MQKSESDHEIRTLSELALRRRTPRSERGATSVEYAIIAALIAAVIVGIVLTLGLQTDALLGSVPW